jgi:hypothetical protein
MIASVTTAHLSRGVLATALLFGVLPISQAGAISAQVRHACAGDYLSNCSSFAPESAQTRQCMRAVGYRLSKGCVQALVAAGEVSKAEVARRAASRH